ncbi:unnamed protein product [Amoebophrya sp. A120]|nr:unnamed protein product [Amoebophrya sp. A120]|eukprot:GSA120T00022108001.1
MSSMAATTTLLAGKMSSSMQRGSLIQCSRICRGGMITDGPFPVVNRTPRAGTVKQAPPRPPTHGKHVTIKLSEEEWLKQTPGTGLSLLSPWRQPYRQTHGDYTQCTVGTFGEMKGCMPKPRRFFQWPPPPRFIDQARLILVQDQLRGEHGELSASALANVTKFSEGVAASRKADITVKDLELGGAGGYTDDYARKLLEWHKKPDGKTIPIPTDQDDIHTFVMDGLRDEMTVEDVALHRIRQQEEFDLISAINVGGVFVFLGMCTILLIPIWCIPMWRPFMSRMWHIIDDDDWCIRRYGRGKLYAF